MSGLFDEFAIGTLTVRNRIVRAATAESLATIAGCPTGPLIDKYRELAEGGIGSIITGYAYVLPDGKPSECALGIFSDEYLAEYRELVDVVHAAGAAIVMQLVYGGSKSKLANDDPRRLVPATETSVSGHPNVSILGASALENPKTHLVPVEATRDDLAHLAEAFGAAAARAKACGFDGVEIHAAHGYLLSQFLSRRFNVRADEYGAGSLGHRARLAVECVKAARAAVGEGYPVLVKINACDDAEDPAGVRGGLSEDESAQVAAWLVEAGANAIDVSGDWHAASVSGAAGEPFFTSFGARLARKLDAPVIVTGGWRRLDAIEKHLAEDGIAAIGMSRPLICEPDLPARWQAGEVEPSKCTGCGHCLQSPGIPCALREKGAEGFQVG